eukprot:9942468-Alexandrium_andersonii.AAC.1
MCIRDRHPPPQQNNKERTAHILAHCLEPRGARIPLSSPELGSAREHAAERAGRRLQGAGARRLSLRLKCFMR